MIDEDDLPQAIFEYGIEKYGCKAQELCEKYGEEFPEKDYDLPDELWLKNFLNWLFYEKIFPETGMTVAEEFAEQSTDLPVELKENVKQIRNMIRSEFVILSKKGDFVQIKDMADGKRYTLKGKKNYMHLKPNMLMVGRIYPFGNYYHTAGIISLRNSPLILDPGVIMGMFDNDQVARIEKKHLRRSSTLNQLLKTYPAHWIDWMCKAYDITQRLKIDKIRGIMEKIKSDLPEIVEDLSMESKDVLRLCIEEGGFVKYGKLKQFDDAFSFFWDDQSTVSPIGELRKKGLLFVGKMVFGERNYKVAFIPVELRDQLKNILRQKNSK